MDLLQTPTLFSSSVNPLIAANSSLDKQKRKGPRGYTFPLIFTLSGFHFVFSKSCGNGGRMAIRRSPILMGETPNHSGWPQDLGPGNTERQGFVSH
jgi:hypothetical protein